MSETQTTRFEQIEPGLTKDRIDRENGILRGVRVLGLQSAKDKADYSLDAQRQACPRFEQMAVALDHDYSSKPLKVADVWGVLSNPRVDDKGTLADLTYLKSHLRTEQILEDAERGTGLFSLSIVADCFEQNGKILRFSPSRCDLVVRGATTRTLFNQDAPPATVPASELEALKIRFEQADARIADLEKRLTIKQSMTPVPPAEPVTPQAASGFDPKAFWND